MKLLSILLIWLLSFELRAQCEFEHINTFETCEEELMDAFDSPGEKKIVIVGIDRNKLGADPQECLNGLIVQNYDYCGNLLRDTFISKLDSFHFENYQYSGLPTFNGRDYSVIGYNFIHIDTEIYIIALMYDETGITRNVFLNLNSNGSILNSRIFQSDKIEGTVQHLMKFDESRLLAVSYSGTQYFFYWMTLNGDLLKTVEVKALGAGLGGIYYGSVTKDKQLCFSGYHNFIPNSDNNSLYAIKIDSFGNKIWDFSLDNNIGAGRNIFIKDTSIIICAFRYDSIRGNDAIALVELISNTGEEINRHIVNVTGMYMQSYGGTLIRNSKEEFFLATNLNPTYNNPNLTAIGLVSLDIDFKYKWHKYFYTKDHTSFSNKVIECSDNTLLLIGKDRRRSPNGFGSKVVKTKNDYPVSNFNVNNKDNEMFIYPTIVTDNINLVDATYRKYKYNIYSLDGSLIENGITQNQIDARKLVSGMYLLFITDQSSNRKVIKFIKI